MEEKASDLGNNDLTIDGGSAVLGVTSRMLVREGPKALSWAVTKFAGQKVLVLGPPGSAKTSFIEFLRWGSHVKKDISIPQTTRTETAHRVFRVKVGAQSQLEFSVSSIIDTAGHDGPSAAAAELVRLKPSMVILMFSVSDPLKAQESGGYSIESWLDFFCQKLADQDQRTVASLLEKCFVVISKTDLRARSTVKKHKAGIKPKFREWLTNERVSKAIVKMPILDCSFLEGDVNEKTANSVVEEMAKALARNGRKAA